MNVDLKSGTLIVEGPRVEGLPDGMLPGCGVLGIREDEANDERVYQPRIVVHPAARRLGLERELVLRLIEMARANEARADTVARNVVKVRESFSPKQVSQKEIYEEIGLKLRRVFWTMRCPLDELPEARPVEGVRIRPLRLPEDTWPLRDALNWSFIDHYDFHPPTPERWEWRLSRHSFRPDLSWVGEIEAEPGKLAGFCLCGIIVEENEALGRKEGWIETLGTIRGWRGKGLGRALLLHGLQSLRDEGMEAGALGVDSENPTGATQLYESVGFRVQDEWLNYGCLLSEVGAAR
jgi:mycothiol synthase